MRSKLTGRSPSESCRQDCWVDAVTWARDWHWMAGSPETSC
jgi:hypothetical protein